MELLLIVLIILMLLAFFGWGYGRYYATPADAELAGPAPYANPLGILAVLLLIALVILFFTGVWF